MIAPGSDGIFPAGLVFKMYRFLFDEKKCDGSLLHGESGQRVKKPGPEDQALGYPFKGMVSTGCNMQNRKFKVKLEQKPNIQHRTSNIEF